MNKQAVIMFVFCCLSLAASDQGQVIRHSLQISNDQFAVSRNIDLAAKHLGRVELLPGKSFSLNEILGERSREKGYKKARVFSGTGEAIDEFGGGMCMISTMLYNLFLKAGLAIKERHPHMKPVQYAPPGFDAAIDFGSKDLVVFNNYQHRVSFFIERQGQLLRGYLMFYGNKKQRTQVALSRQVSKAVIQQGAGFRVKTIRSFYAGHELLREEILSVDTFRGQP